MKAVVFAYHEIGYVCMEELLNAGVEIPLLFTHEDDPSENIWFRPPRILAEKYKIPYVVPTSLKDEKWLSIVRKENPDYIFSFYYRYIIPKEYLSIPKVAPLNLHGSLLPKYRGRQPANWVLINGETETGVTLHIMEEKPDTGPIVAQKRVIIEFEDDISTLNQKLVEAARSLMREVLPDLKLKKIVSVPQSGPSSYFSKRKPEDGLILWEKDAISLYNLVRAVTHPYPGAFTFFGGRKLYIWKAYPKDEEHSFKPGTVVSETPFFVATGRGFLRLDRVQLEKEEEMEGSDFARIYNMKGKVLGGIT
ncbi:MAG: formyltransferase [Desulfobacterota bacterium]|nr:formyltransferase [Thermodesulfobacteriota bacterium]MDW8002114.1 formyltransferase [Deltaproteobacteria bacterium]